MNDFEMGAGRGIVSADADSTNTLHETPESEYKRRLRRREEQLTRIRVLHWRLWTYLIVVVLTGVVIVSATFSSHLISPLWTLLPSIIALSIIQSLSENARTHAKVQRIVSFYEFGVARLHHQWQGRGVDGKGFLPNNHIYASDLDLFGTGSLFELLCTARTGVGRAMLADWLLNPAKYSHARERQVAISELRDMLDFREDWVSVEGGHSIRPVPRSATGQTSLLPTSRPMRQGLR
jgi:hypothetical protein